MRNKIIIVILSIGLPLMTAGCLQTRASSKEVEEKHVLKKQVATLQQTTADVNSRFVDLEDDSRRLNGRLEVLESKLNQSAAKSEKGSSAIEQKVNDNHIAYREEFALLRTEIENLKLQLASLLEDQKRVSQAKAQADAQAAESDKNPFSSAEQKFESKNWKEAILDYEKYRKANPKGKQVATATYKIGVAFQELGLTDEAKAFYEEVISKHPKSKDAERAQSRLKKMKK